MQQSRVVGVREHTTKRPSVLALNTLLLLLDLREFFHDANVELNILLLEFAVLPLELL